jgi:hypothetical protein
LDRITTFDLATGDDAIKLSVVSLSSN